MESTDVLFVCVHNAGRSPMAEAMFNYFSHERGLPYRAGSAGTVGGKELNPAAVEAMREMGIDMSSQRPKLLDQALVDGAGKIVSMGCGVDASACPAKFLVTEDWELEDPAGAAPEKVREIRDQIRRRVENLLEELATSGEEIQGTPGGR